MDKFSEAERRFKQALRDLEAARGSLNNGYYEWSCFQSQQAAEKSLKALLHGLGLGAWGIVSLNYLTYLRIGIRSMN
ncbi:HEPN domain-containing protein [Caldivirga sp.]|uniref:HEPN domain-containing protein n=1 Tax=Caldivirga sp. TaxID=2080243 RepID=UPI0025C48F8A|nr:HEPN domain-containing protein [Caldivirga sp.]